MSLLEAAALLLTPAVMVEAWKRRGVHLGRDDVKPCAICAWTHRDAKTGLCGWCGQNPEVANGTGSLAAMLDSLDDYD